MPVDSTYGYILIPSIIASSDPHKKLVMANLMKMVLSADYSINKV